MKSTQLTQADKNKGRGGHRTGAGRKKIKPESPLADGNKGFATRVLARIGKPGWRDFADIAKVKSDEDLAVHFLATNAAYDQFNKLLDRKYGKPVQQIRVGNPEGESFQVDVASARDKLLGTLAG